MTSLAFAASYLALSLALLWRMRVSFAGLTLVVGTIWLLYSPSLLDWLHHLGSDSFSEAQNFDLVEAWNFLQSLDQVLRRESFRATGLVIVSGAAILLPALGAGFLLSRHRWSPGSRPVLYCSTTCLLASLSLQIYPAAKAFQSNSRYYETILEHFDADSVPALIPDHPTTDLNVVVHIGESHTSMHMGVYGYPRRTTPELADFISENHGLLLFHNVFSPHAHTAPSLLEALSVGVDPAEDVLPIGSRRRISVIDLLNRAGISTALVSNQGQAGTWNNLASTVIFRNTSTKEFSFNSLWLGELEHGVARPLDHEFLVRALERKGVLQDPGPRVVFLHSYAGHGPYLRNIDESFRQPVDDMLNGIPAAAIVGHDIANPERVVEKVEQYDSSVRYVDHCIVSILRRVQRSPHPAAYIYFSDHGEAVYAGRRHDSSRFLHEMARVPLVVYFNDAAVNRYPDAVRRLREAADAKTVSTLAQFPATLLALFGLNVDGGVIRGLGQDAVDDLPPILTRETGTGHTYILLGDRPPAGASVADAMDVTDPHTLLFKRMHARPAGAPAICLQGAHTFGQAVRGAIVSDCLQFDLGAGPDGLPAVLPTPSVPSGLELEDLLAIAGGYGRTVWIAADGDWPVEQCHALERKLSPTLAATSPDVLVMFPLPNYAEQADLRSCMSSLRGAGAHVGLNIPVSRARACLNSLRGNAPGSSVCTELSNLLSRAILNGSATDVGIDYATAALVGQLELPGNVHWNTWNVSLSDLASDSLSRFRRIAVDSSFDPNRR